MSKLESLGDEHDHKFSMKSDTNGLCHNDSNLSSLIKQRIYKLYGTSILGFLYSYTRVCIEIPRSLACAVTVSG